MSDDLISREVLLGELNSLRIELNGISCRKEFKKTVNEVMQTLKHLIEDQPQAFDKGKVLSEMKKEYEDAICLYNGNIGTAHSFSSLVRKDAWREAIEIVEKGGIE